MDNDIPASFSWRQPHQFVVRLQSLHSEVGKALPVGAPLFGAYPVETLGGFIGSVRITG